MRGQPLTLFERERIELYVRGKWGLRQIAKTLYRDHSVIVRELQRNRGKDGVYRAKSAHQKAEQRSHRPHRRRLDDDDLLRNHVAARLIEGWSPEQISGRLKNRPESWMIGKKICHEAIYQYIYDGEGRFMGLYQYLTRKHKVRQRRFSRTQRKSKGILYRTPIKLRPKEINEKQTFGNWESDSVIFRKQRQALSVQRERKSQKVLISRLEDKSAPETHAAIEKQLELIGREFFKSITFDNGTEGAWHWKLRLDHNIDTYHCDPYCSWQKGGVENANGLIRRDLPIETNLSSKTNLELYEIQERINNRPRKTLNYQTPNEVFASLKLRLVH